VIRLILASLLGFALTGCEGGVISGTTLGQTWRSAAPGIRLRCSGRCIVYPANVDNAPAPGERPTAIPF
jgi:hypothetical protein